MTWCRSGWHRTLLHKRTHGKYYLKGRLAADGELIGLVVQWLRCLASASPARRLLGKFVSSLSVLAFLSSTCMINPSPADWWPGVHRAEGVSWLLLGDWSLVCA